MAGERGVIVIGAGPCGLMLAIELGRRGIPVIVLEEKTSPARFPAANATQARTMEHYRRLGFADEIRALGLPADYPTDIAYFDRYARHELARIRLPSAQTARAIIRSLSGSWSAAELPHRCSQMYIERVLREKAQACRTVSIRAGWRVGAVRRNPDAVAVEAERVDGGARALLAAAYVVGADGAASRTRKMLGYDLVGEGGRVRDFLGGRMLALHFRSARVYDVIPHPRAWMYWAVNRERRGIMACLNGRDEFVFHTQLREGEEASRISDGEANAFFHLALGARLDIDIIARSAWNAGYTLVAEKFGSGRVLLAGDAAHLFTPTGGLGYNTAVEDAVNLGWKLAAVLKGWGGPVLIDSYEVERRAIALRNTAHARAFADSVGGFVPPQELEQEGAAGEAARKVAGDRLGAHARFEFDIPGITFGTRYDGSPVVVPDGRSPPMDTVNDYVPSACPGGRAPHLWLPEGRSLYDALGFEFTLLRLGTRPIDAELFQAAAAALGIPLAVVDVAGEEARDLYGADLALVRPDQIVAWRGNAAAGAAAVLRGVAGHG
jgi:2-polyprenyl-6-methoxyphenol hydroxylase-like FAD-dependent oxidoreductase